MFTFVIMRKRTTKTFGLGKRSTASFEPTYVMVGKSLSCCREKQIRTWRSAMWLLALLRISSTDMGTKLLTLLKKHLTATRVCYSR